MRRISVPEYGRIPVSDLSPDELRRLRAFDEYRGASVPSVFDWRFRQYIRPLNLVGVVQVPGLQIEILPKIDGVATATSTWHTDDPVCRTAQSNLLFMLRYAKRIRLLDADLSALRLQNMSLLDMLVHLFIQRTAEELQRGLDHGYIYQEECLSVLRGKLLFSQQVKQNVVNAARFHVRYDEYIPDTWMNRILKAACRLLFGSVSSGSLRRRLLELLQHLSAVSDMPVTQEHFQQIRWNRNNERLRPCVEFARMVLTQRSPSPARGATETFSLLFPMDALFEEFVAGFIMRHSADLGLRRDRIRVQATGSRRWLLRDEDKKGAFRLKPDILILHDSNEPACILDTKWKRLSSEDSHQGVSQSDLYQLHAYARRFECPTNILLYPSGRNLRERTWTIDGDASKTVAVKLLDMNFDFAASKDRLVENLRSCLGAPNSWCKEARTCQLFSKDHDVKQMNDAGKRAYNAARTLFAKWLDATSIEPESRKKLLRGFQSLHTALPEHDFLSETMGVLLDGPRFKLANPVVTGDCMVAVLPDGLAVSTFVPGWGFGWHKTFPDEEVYDVLSWLMHYSRQYIHRSIVLRVLLAVCDETGVPLHPFGLRTVSMRWSQINPLPSPERGMAATLAMLGEEPWLPPGVEVEVPLPEEDDELELTLSQQQLGINTLDPDIHEAAFHYLRGVSLASQGFLTEALVAFHCLTEVANRFLVVRKKNPKHSTPGEVAKAMGLKGTAGEPAAALELARNYFGAHPGGWRWWDFDEMFGDDFPDVAAFTRAVLSRMNDLEVEHRLTEPAPELWSTWFWQNFKALWISVWFERETKFWNSRAT